MSSFLPKFSALQGKRLHLGVCGSIAAYKAVELLRALQQLDVDVSVTLTEAATRFISPLTFESLGASIVYGPMFSPAEGGTFGHLQPGRTADAFMLAPATATSIARLAGGLADEMLSAQALAFSGPVIIAPAMNPLMWKNQATQSNVALLRSRGVSFILPEDGVVACGDEGQGKLAALEKLVYGAASALLPKDMQGIKLLVTLGPTQEKWDGVRVWTNPSTGRMGSAVIYAASLRGAEVFAVAGPSVGTLPPGIKRFDTQSAKQMYEAALEVWPDCTHGVFTAAVADFYPEPFGAAKFKKNKSSAGFTINFLPNPDILASLSSISTGKKLLGFAAETEMLEERVREKLIKKNCHLLAGNLLGCENSGFGSTNNTVFVADCQGREEHWPVLSKADVAWRLLSWLLTL